MTTGNWKSTLSKLGAALLVGALGAASYHHLASNSQCCTQGAACCKPGAECCKHHVEPG